MPMNFKEIGSMMSYYCSDCGEHINALDNATYVQVVVCSALPGGQQVDLTGKPKVLGDIMAQPVPRRIYCVECFHDAFGPELEVLQPSVSGSQG